MPEESPVQSEARPPTDSAAEANGHSTTSAKVVVRVTAHNNHWLAGDTWDAPVVTHYGASTVRLMPQRADDAFLDENQALLDQWYKDAQSRGLSGQTVKGYRSSVRRFVRYLGPRSLIAVRSVDLHGYADFLRATRKITVGTLSSNFTSIGSLYDYLADQDITSDNPVPRFVRRHLGVQLREANKKRTPRRQLLSVDEMSLLVQSVSDLRDRAIIVLLAKTGIRCGELVAMDVKDIDWREQSIEVKPLPKRTNLTAFFDAETEGALKAWLEVRAAWTGDKAGPLFVAGSERISTPVVGKVVSDAARRLGLHDPTGGLRFRFTPHACRHWFTTHLLRAGMKDSFVQILRGDSPGRSMDVYHHIDWQAVRQEYLARIPKLLDERQRKRAAAARAAFAAAAPQAKPAAERRGRNVASAATLELRRLIAEELAVGKLRTTREYGSWLQDKTRRSLGSARETARLALRALGVPPAQRGPAVTPATLELRRLIASDASVGQVHRPAEYGRWLHAKAGRPLASACQTASRELLRFRGLPTRGGKPASKARAFEAPR